MKIKITKGKWKRKSERNKTLEYELEKEMEEVKQ